MGLSDEERITKVYWCIHHLSQLKFSEYGYEGLNEKIAQVWPAIQNSSSNGIGSELDQERFDQGIYASAFQGVIEHFRPKEEENSWEKSKYFQFYQTYLPDRTKWLSGDASSLMKLAGIIAGYYYAANRYDDKLAQKLKNTSDLLAQMQGIIYQHFSSNPIFLEAWMAEKIIHRCWKHNDQDLIDSWIVEENLHHHLRSWKMSDSDRFSLVKFHKNPLKTTQDRFCAIAFLTHDRIHYPHQHQHQKLLKKVAQHNLIHPEDMVNIELVKVWGKSATWARTQKEKFNRERYSNQNKYCSLFGKMSGE